MLTLLLPFSTSIAFSTSFPIIQLEKISKNYHIKSIAVSFKTPASPKIYSAYLGANKNTLFQTGSITKSFIADIILQLQTEGKLNINDKIGRWLPQYPRWRHITISQLLLHTSGIFNYTELNEFNHIKYKDTHYKQWTPRKIIALAYQEKDYFQPGNGWHYSNTGYLLLGLIIEKITHHNLAWELNHRLFKPLKLFHTFYTPEKYAANISKNMARGYYNGKDVSDINLSWAGSAGAIVSNSTDITKWLADFLITSRLPLKEKRELNKLVSLKTGKPVSVRNKEINFGIAIKHGYKKRYGYYWFYPGTTTGYAAIMLWLPSKQVVMTILTNNGNLSRKARRRIAFQLIKQIT